MSEQTAITMDDLHAAYQRLTKARHNYDALAMANTYSLTALKKIQLDLDYREARQKLEAARDEYDTLLDRYARRNVDA